LTQSASKLPFHIEQTLFHVISFSFIYVRSMFALSNQKNMKITKAFISLPLVIFLFTIAVKVQIDMIKKRNDITSTTGVSNTAKKKKPFKMDETEFKNIISSMPANSTNNIKNINIPVDEGHAITGLPIPTFK
jgi:hypothetical protein